MLARRPLHFALAAVLLLAAPNAPAESIPVVLTQGATRGFLIVRSEAGAIIGHGEVIQFAHGDRVTTRLTFRFRDGSLDDETAVYTQHNVFQLLSDHHIQRGPFFSKPVDLTVRANGEITSRTVGKDGKHNSESIHIDLPPGTANGMIGTLLINVRPNAPEFKLPMIAPTGRGRLIQLAVSPAGESAFSCVAGIRRTATIFRIKPDLGGVAGVVAPLIGKQPGDVFVWILEGEVPAIVRRVGQLAEGGPSVSVELAGTIFPRAISVTK